MQTQSRTRIRAEAGSSSLPVACKTNTMTAMATISSRPNMSAASRLASGASTLAAPPSSDRLLPARSLAHTRPLLHSGWPERPALCSQSQWNAQILRGHNTRAEAEVLGCDKGATRTPNRQSAVAKLLLCFQFSIFVKFSNHNSAS
jgi:hypothetical protein